MPKFSDSHYDISYECHFVKFFKYYFLNAKCKANITNPLAKLVHVIDKFKERFFIVH